MLLASGEQVSVSLLGLALRSRGIPAVALTGGQCGIQTDSAFNAARIESIDTTRIFSELNRGNVVIIAGFQGVTHDQEITTLGRKSGKPRTKPIWFVYEQGHLYIQSGKEGKTHWYRNLQKNAQMWIKIAHLALTGKAKFIEDRAETERVHTLFNSKYTFARFAGLVGSSIGQGKVVEVELLTEAEQE